MREPTSAVQSFQDILEEQGISVAAYANKAQLDELFVRTVLMGDAPLDDAFIGGIVRVYGGDPEFWQRREAVYQERKKAYEEKRQAKAAPAEEEWVVQGRYCSTWDDLCTYETERAAEQGKKEYDDNIPGTEHRIVRRAGTVELVIRVVVEHHENAEKILRDCVDYGTFADCVQEAGLIIRDADVRLDVE